MLSIVCVALKPNVCSNRGQLRENLQVMVPLEKGRNITGNDPAAYFT